MEPGRRPRPGRQGPLTSRAGAVPGAAVAVEAARRALGASTEEAIAALVVAADGWSAVDGVGAPPVPLDRARVATLAGRLRSALGDEVDDPHLPGAVHEQGHAAPDRRRRGVHFTPPEVCAGVMALAVDVDPDRAAPDPAGRASAGPDPAGRASAGPDPADPDDDPAAPRRVLDPACGGGAFLLAAAERLGPRTGLVGVDLDPRAAWCTRLVLRHHPGPVEVTVADTLSLAPEALGLVDLVVGNPPFAAQLRQATARTAGRRSTARERFGELLGPYADGALAFLLDGLERVGDRGRVALVLPWSVLASRDARALRQRLAPALRHVWLGGADVFPGALVHVCGLVLDGAGSPPAGGAVSRSWGPRFDPLPAAARDGAVAAGEWGPLLADALGVPPLAADRLVAWAAGPTVGDVATVTAGFRDEFYAVTSAVRDLGSEARRPAGVHPVVSVGLIDPLGCGWGERAARMGGRSVVRPVVSPVDLAGDPRVARWVAARLVPKLLVATQTRVLEVAVDELGDTVPLTPVVSVEPGEPARLWHVAAALTGPVATVLAWRRSAGTALSAGAVKVSAAGVRALPLPTEAEAWDRAAELARRVAANPTPEGWRDLAVAHTAAFGVVDDALVDWWLARLGQPAGRR